MAIMKMHTAVVMILYELYCINNDDYAVKSDSGT